MVSLFLLLGCNLNYIVDLFAALHELASASARILIKLASSVRALLKPYGDTLNVSKLQKLPSSVMICLPASCKLDLDQISKPESLSWSEIISSPGLREALLQSCLAQHS